MTNVADESPKLEELDAKLGELWPDLDKYCCAELLKLLDNEVQGSDLGDNTLGLDTEAVDLGHDKSKRLLRECGDTVQFDDNTDLEDLLALPTGRIELTDFSASGKARENWRDRVLGEATEWYWQWYELAGLPGEAEGIDRGDICDLDNGPYLRPWITYARLPTTVGELRKQVAE